jgi:hypothetical protein
VLPKGSGMVFLLSISVAAQRVYVSGVFFAVTMCTCFSVPCWSDLKEMFPEERANKKGGRKNALIRCEEEESNLVTN